MSRNLQVLTIGVYGFDADGFFRALTEAGVDTFCDLRSRRGLRGSEYAFANSARLRAGLAELGIRYHHFPELAPAAAIRGRQYEVDRATHTGKRQRTELSPEFRAAYREQCLAGFDPGRFLGTLGENARVAALFCVEREPAACHRSLLAERLETELGVTVRHLLPG